MKPLFQVKYSVVPDRWWPVWEIFSSRMEAQRAVCNAIADVDYEIRAGIRAEDRRISQSNFKIEEV